MKNKTLVFTEMQCHSKKYIYIFIMDLYHLNIIIIKSDVINLYINIKRLVFCF